MVCRSIRLGRHCALPRLIQSRWITTACKKPSAADPAKPGNRWKNRGAGFRGGQSR